MRFFDRFRNKKEVERNFGDKSDDIGVGMLQVNLSEHLEKSFFENLKLTLEMTKMTVGGKITRLDIEFSDGTSINGVKTLKEKIIELPQEYANKEIKEIYIPEKQF